MENNVSLQLNNETAVKTFYETIIPVDCFGQEEVTKAQSIFESYVRRGIIITDSFSEDVWQFCDEYQNLSMHFDLSEITYVKYYQNVFGLCFSEFKQYVKAFIVYSLGQNVLNTIRDALNDIRDLVKKSPEEIEGIEFRRPNTLLDFIGLLPAADETICDSILEQLEFCAENMLEGKGSQRTLAYFNSYFIFNDILNHYWNSDLDSAERLFFYPLYLWWNITTILPQRPREFILTPRDCLKENNGKYTLTIRRNNLKGNHGQIQYNIQSDYREESYSISKSLYQSIKQYIDSTEKYQDNVTHTLLRAEPHYYHFHHKKPYTSRLYTYINLSCCLRLFYSEIIEQKYGYKIVTDSSGNGDKEIEFIHLGDARHIAMINLIMQGGTPTLAMLLAGHADITMSSHYFSNIATLVSCQTYSMFRKQLSSGESLVFGTNYNVPNIKSLKYVEIEDGARCYSPRFAIGDISDCIKSTGAYAELGYCYKCPYYRKMDSAFFSETEDIYKGQIESDSLYLKKMVNKYRIGRGFKEEVNEALLRLQSSTANYHQFCIQRKLYDKEAQPDAEK